MKETARRIRTCIGLIRIADVIALGLITVGTVKGTYVQSLQGRGLAVTFVVLWMASAAKRLADVRTGRCQPLQAGPEAGSALIVAVLAGIGPWMVLAVLQSTYPSLGVWTPIVLPSWLKVIGVVLAIISIARRPRQASVDVRSEHLANPFIPVLTFDSAILALAMFLTSGSLVIVIVAALWMAALLVTRLHLEVASVDDPRWRSFLHAADKPAAV